MSRFDVKEKEIGFMAGCHDISHIATRCGNSPGLCGIKSFALIASGYSDCSRLDSEVAKSTMLLSNCVFGGLFVV
jgi:hypothetical protein